MENQIIGPILPLRDLVVYPSITSPLFVGRAKSIDAINFAMNSNNKIIYLFTQKEPTTDDPQVNDVFSYGVKSKIIQFYSWIFSFARTSSQFLRKITFFLIFFGRPFRNF